MYYSSHCVLSKVQVLDGQIKHHVFTASTFGALKHRCTVGCVNPVTPAPPWMMTESWWEHLISIFVTFIKNTTDFTHLWHLPRVIPQKWSKIEVISGWGYGLLGVLWGKCWKKDTNFRFARVNSRAVIQNNDYSK